MSETGYPDNSVINKHKMAFPPPFDPGDITFLKL
jgi:hypothetical protein